MLRGKPNQNKRPRIMILSHLAYRSASCRLRNCNMRHVAHWWVPECSKNYRWVCIILICIRVTSCDHVLVLFPTFRSLDKRKNVGFRISGVAATPSLDTRAGTTKQNETGLAWQLVFPGSCVTSKDARSVRHSDGQVLAFGNSSRRSKSEEMFWTLWT